MKRRVRRSSAEMGPFVGFGVLVRGSGVGIGASLVGWDWACAVADQGVVVAAVVRARNASTEGIRGKCTVGWGWGEVLGVGVVTVLLLVVFQNI